MLRTYWTVHADTVQSTVQASKREQGTVIPLCKRNALKPPCRSAKGPRVKKVGRVVPSEETAQAEQVFPLSL